MSGLHNFLSRRYHALLTAFYTCRALRKVQSHGEGVRVNAPCIFTPRTIIGNGCHFNGMRVAGKGSVSIGNHFHSGMDCLILTSNHNYDTGEALPYDATHVCRHVEIEDNVWMGDKVIVVGNVHIGEGAVLAAGAVVVKDVPPCAVVGGNPARILKYRNREHYDRLKAEGSFH